MNHVGDEGRVEVDVDGNGFKNINVANRNVEGVGLWDHDEVWIRSIGFPRTLRSGSSR